MSEEQSKLLIIAKKLTSIGFIVGITLFFSHFFVSDINGEYFLFIGIGIMVSSLILFGFGTCIAAMQEVSDRRPKVSKPTKPQLYLVKSNKTANRSRKMIG